MLCPSRKSARPSALPAFAVGLLLAVLPAKTTAHACAGDCNDDRGVEVGELVTGVAIAQGEMPLEDCSAFDTDGSRQLTIEELVQAVRAAFADQCRFAVGMTVLDLVDQVRDRPLRTNVWYPADDAAEEVDLALDAIFAGVAARDAPLSPARSRYPVVLLSHGSGGGGADQAWLAEHLAARGSVVAAPYHFGNAFGNDSPEGTVAVWRRPPDLTFVLDELLAHPVFGERIDPARVGAAGFSSGGYSVIALAGARYDVDRSAAYCAGPQAGPECELASGVDFSAIDDVDRASASYRDARVRAVFAMAPAVGQGFDAAGLAPVEIPVRIVAGVNDELVPYALHAAHYARWIADSELVPLATAGHFAFMPICNEIGLTVDPRVCLPRSGTCIAICQDGNLDRTAVHRRVRTLAESFFASRL